MSNGSRPVDAVFFDLFGTLAPLGPLDDACEAVVARGRELAARWRARQLEASWLRTVMDRWTDFDTVTSESLTVALGELAIAIPEDRARRLVDAFLGLPIREDAPALLERLHGAGLQTGILSNASRATIARAVAHAGLTFTHLLSADDARHFKPHPSVYRLAVEATGSTPDRIGFVTSNGWDAAGAATFGLRVAWLRVDPSAQLPAVGAPKPTIAGWPELELMFSR